MATISSAVRTVDLSGASDAEATMIEITRMISDGWRIESATPINNSIYYILRRNLKELMQ